jgi:hypothetical protein
MGPSVRYEAQQAIIALSCKSWPQNVATIMAKRSRVSAGKRCCFSRRMANQCLFGAREFLTVKSPTLPGSIAELVCRLPDKDKQALLDLLHKATQVTLTTHE